MPAAVLTIDINARLANLEAAVAKIPGSFRGANKQLESELSRINGKLVEFGRTAVLALGLPLGAGALLSFMKDVAGKAAESERSLNQLNAVIKATGNSAGLTAGDLAEMGDKLQSKTIFDDDAIRAAETALLRFRTVQGDTFREAIEMAPNVASALGTTLPEAAVALGRALTDPEHGMKALKAAGLSLSQQNIDLAARFIETGDKARAQQIVLDDLRKSIGGASEADNQGVYGASKRLSRAWDDMLKLLGKGISGNGGWTSALAEQIDKIVKSAGTANISLGTLFDLMKRRSAIAIAGDVLAGRNPLIDNSRVVSGKISGTPFDPEKEKAEEAKQRQDELEAQEQRYLDNKTALQKLAQVTAIVNQERLVKLKATLDNESALYASAYGHNEVSITAFYAHQRSAAETAANATIAALGREGEALEKQAASPGTNREERAAIELRLRGLGVQQAQAQAELQAKLTGLNIQESDSVRRLKDDYEELSIRLAELRDNTVEAANRSFALANRDLFKRLKQEAGAGTPGAGEALAELHITGQLVDVRARLTKELKDYSLTLDGLGIATQRIDIAQSSGSLTEIQALERKSALNKLYVGVLQEQLVVLERIARESGRDEDLIKVEQLKVAMEQLAAQTDLVADKFNNIGRDAFSQFLQDLTSGDWKKAIQNLGVSLQSQLTKVAADNVAQIAFGKDGPLSGFGSFFAKIFGGGKDAAGTGVVNSQILSLGTSATTSTTGLSALTSAAYAAAAALATVGGGGSGGGLSGLFGGGSSGFGGPDPDFPIGDSPFTGPSFGTYAVGTPYVPRDGPYKLHRGERVVTAAENRADHSRGLSTTVVNHNTFTINGPTNRPAQQQLTSRFLEASRRGARRR